MGLRRRDLLKGLGASGALLVAQPFGAWGTPLMASSPPSGPRASRLFPEGSRLVHGDLHNHSHLSDGQGDHRRAFDTMRSAGLDVAALTDHSTVSFGGEQMIDYCADSSPEHGRADPCRSLAGLNEEGWRITGQLANDADAPGRFTAIRGFEWSSPHLGHVDVWFSDRWVDPLNTVGINARNLGDHFRDVAVSGGWIDPVLDNALSAEPEKAGMAPFYSWLRTPPQAARLGGGSDGLAAFAHPNREDGVFSDFSFDPELVDQFVGLEIFNRHEDYLFKRFAEGYSSPLSSCLDAGWRVGLLGVSDEHGPEWGFQHAKGRTGLWVQELTRNGVREALESRRVFATRERGLRVDAAANGVRMGNTVWHAGGQVTFEVDVDGGPDWAGRDLAVQVLRPGGSVPSVPHVEEARQPGGDEVIRFTILLDPADGHWVVLRIADPHAENATPGPGGHPCNNRALAYTSPFWLVQPDRQ